MTLPCRIEYDGNRNRVCMACRMNGSPDSFATQSQRYLRASEACKKAIDGRKKL